MSVRDDYGFLTTYMEYGEEDEEEVDWDSVPSSHLYPVKISPYSIRSLVPGRTGKPSLPNSQSTAPNLRKMVYSKATAKHWHTNAICDKLQVLAVNNC